MTTLRIPRRITRRPLLLSEFARLGVLAGRVLSETEIDLISQQPAEDAESIVVFLSTLPAQEPPTAEELQRLWLEREQRVDGRVRRRSEDIFGANPHD